jgi:hypothetical protein
MELWLGAVCGLSAFTAWLALGLPVFPGSFRGLGNDVPLSIVIIGFIYDHAIWVGLVAALLLVGAILLIRSSGNRVVRPGRVALYGITSFLV